MPTVPLIAREARFGTAFPLWIARDRRPSSILCRTIAAPRDGLVDTAAASEKTTLAEIRPPLSKARLTELCQSLDLDDSGKEKSVLVERIAGTAKAEPHRSRRVSEPAKRWRSASRNGTLRINSRVMQAPVALVDYLVLHELVHLIREDRSREFWATPGRLMLDYEQRKRRLRELGPRLVW